MKMSEDHKRKISLAHKGMKKPWAKNSPVTKRGKIVSSETRHKMSLIAKKNGNMPPVKSGMSHYNWQGGITPVNKRIRKTKEYTLWRNAVLERDGHKCIWCESTENLHADHIKPFAFYPELRFAIDNGRTLCVDCHKKTDTWGTNKFKIK